MEKLIKFIYQTDSLVGLIISILLALIGIFGSILLVFWWQVNSNIFAFINSVISEGRYYRSRYGKNYKYKQIRDISIQLAKLIKRQQTWSRLLTVFVVFLIIFIISLSSILLIVKIFALCQQISAFSRNNRLLCYQILSGIVGMLLPFLIFVIILLLRAGSINKVSDLLPFQEAMIINAFDLDESEISEEKSEKISKKRRITMGISSKHAIYIGAMGAISFVLAFVLGGAVNALTGIPLTGGILNGVIVGAMITIGIKGVDKFGAATLLWFVFTILAIPTFTFGPPGWYKVIVGVISGIVWDAVISMFKRSKFGYVLSAGVGASVITYGVFISAKLLGLPAAEKLAKALYFLIPMNFVISCVGAIVGLWLFSKYFSKMSFIESLKA